MIQSRHTYTNLWPSLGREKAPFSTCRLCSKRVGNRWCDCRTYAHIDELCLTYGSYEWVMSHVWMRHVSRMNASCHTHGWVMSHTWMIHVSHRNESCHTIVLKAWRQSMGWLQYHAYIVMSHVCMRVTHMNASCVQMSHEPSIWHINACHAHESVMSHVWMSHVSPMNESCLTYEWVMSSIWMSHV